MSLSQIERFLNESVEKGVCWERIRLLGGEPTLHRDFFAIVELCRAYKRDFAPATRIEVATNGHGTIVQNVIARIPSDVHVKNSAKATNVQDDFASFSIAPVDLEQFTNSDFRNGCSVIEDAGFGLSPSGYYPCAVAGSIDRIFGWNMGRQTLPDDSDTMEDLLERSCSHCGHFKRHEGRALPGQTTISATWRDAYIRYRQKKPKLSTYGDSVTPNAQPAAMMRFYRASIDGSVGVLNSSPADVAAVVATVGHHTGPR
jgi:hypothetical protein